MSDLLDLRGVAERCRCSIRTVRRAIDNGELRASRLARGVWVIKAEDLDAWLTLKANRPRTVDPVSTVIPASDRTRALSRRRPGRGAAGRLEITPSMGRSAA